MDFLVFLVYLKVSRSNSELDVAELVSDSDFFCPVVEFVFLTFECDLVWEVEGVAVGIDVLDGLKTEVLEFDSSDH